MLLVVTPCPEERREEVAAVLHLTWILQRDHYLQQLLGCWGSLWFWPRAPMCQASLSEPPLHTITPPHTRTPPHTDTITMCSRASPKKGFWHPKKSFHYLSYFIFSLRYPYSLSLSLGLSLTCTHGCMCVYLCVYCGKAFTIHTRRFPMYMRLRERERDNEG